MTIVSPVKSKNGIFIPAGLYGLTRLCSLLKKPSAGASCDRVDPINIVNRMKLRLRRVNDDIFLLLWNELEEEFTGLLD